jgi:outer membrane lipoprotein carrier protein
MQNDISESSFAKINDRFRGETRVTNTLITKQSGFERTLLGYLMITLTMASVSNEVTASDPTIHEKGKRNTQSDDSFSKKEIKDIVDKIQSYYANAGDYQASFTQTTSHKMFANKLERAYGTVKFKKGGLMRWEYAKPEKKLFIYDGKTLWIYEPEVPQVFSGSADADRLRRALAFVSGEGKLLDEYTIKLLNSAKCGFLEGTVLSLIPKDIQSPYDHVELYLDKATYRVVRSVIVDHENNRNRLDFSNPSIGNNLSDQEFTFTPPKGVPVIDPMNQQ